MKTISGMELKQVLMTIKNETQPIDGHDDSGAIQDCWNEVFETLDMLAEDIQKIKNHIVHSSQTSSEVYCNPIVVLLHKYI